jgi:hypothetical protein
MCLISKTAEQILKECGIGGMADIRSREGKFIYINIMKPLLKMKLESMLDSCLQISQSREDYLYTISA